jgi:multiple sugar transport system substrate-binding protein
MRLCTLAACVKLKQAGIDPVLQVTCRDRNRLAVQSDLLGAASFGITNVLALTGDHVMAGDHPEARPVFDLESVQLLQVIGKLNAGTDLAGNELHGTPDFFPGAVKVETVKGHVTGIPIVTEQEIIYYRKDLFAKDKIKVPTTLAQLEAAAKHFNKPSEGFYGFVARGQRAAAVTQFSSYLYSFGGHFNVEDTATVNTPEAIKAFSFYGSMLKNFGPPGVLNMSWPQALAIFAQGKHKLGRSSSRHVDNSRTYTTEISVAVVE